VKPPQWIDEEAVFKQIEGRLRNFRDEVANADDYSDEVIRAMADLMVAEIERDDPFKDRDQQAAFKEALRGKLVKMTDLLRPPRTQSGIYMTPTHTVTLSSDNWDLIIEFLEGKRSFKSGKEKGRRGRPKMSPNERRAATPTHDAADFVPIIIKILCRMFPDQPAKNIRNRALIFAERIGKVKSHQQKKQKKQKKPRELAEPREPGGTLANYYRRGPKDRRRV
jgi:hypothetical protein